ncbi:MAG: tetratricopeptide repeat protein [Bacteroidota bacterium]
MIFIGILTAFALIGIALISRSITTFFHEMGHALPSLLYTEGEVGVYVGSYGDISDSWHFQIGRLKMYLRFNFLQWNLGMCTHQAASTYWASLLIVLGGPLASLSFAAILLYLMIYGGFSENVIGIMGIFVLAALIDFFVNIIPSGRPMLLHDGSRLYNDGTQLQQLLELRLYPAAYFDALEQYHQEGQAEKAKDALAELFMAKKPYRGMYYPVVDLLIKDKDYETALEFYQNLTQHYALKASDYAQIGDIYQGLNNYPEAIKYFGQALYLQFTDTLVLNKRGYLYQQQGDHQKALIDFDRAIHYGGHLPVVYSNRALSLLKSRHKEAALADLETALQLDEQHPMSHMYMGLYYQELGDYTKALQFLEQAKALGVDHHGIDYQIEITKQQIR